MRTLVAVKLEILLKTRTQLPHRFVIVQVKVFVLHRPPQSLDEYVVQRATAAIHADRDLVSFQHTRKLPRRELAPLIGIEDLWLLIASESSNASMQK